jgi:hypothetical protein
MCLCQSSYIEAHLATAFVSHAIPQAFGGLPLLISGKVAYDFTMTHAQYRSSFEEN